MTPAPMRTSFSGTFFRDKAPVEETIVSSSISIPGKGVTSDPVAIRMFFVLTTSVEPSSFRAVTSFGPVILPCPLTSVTLELKRNYFFIKSRKMIENK